MPTLPYNIDQLPDDAEVAESNFISRYSKRKKSLETMCLAEYVVFYDVTRSYETESNSDAECDVDSEAVSESKQTAPSAENLRESFVHISLIQSMIQKTIPGTNSCYICHGEMSTQLYSRAVGLNGARSTTL